MSSLLISIIVCTFNRAALLPYCLRSLVQQTIGSSKYEVIIVDNNSTDNTGGVVASFIEQSSNFRYVEEDKQGLSHSRNRGWKEARGRYVAFIDDDAKACPDWAERIVHAFESVSPAPVAVGGEILPWYEQHPPEWFTDDLEIRTWGSESGFLQAPIAESGFSGSNMAFKRSILESYGGFSDEYGMVGNKVRFGDESELFRRIYQDYSSFWYDPEIQVQHWVPVRNMRLWYRLKRAYRVGVSSTRIQGEHSLSDILRTFLVVLITGCTLPLRVNWGQKNWQRNFLKHAHQCATSLGMLRVLISHYPRRKSFAS